MPAAGGGNTRTKQLRAARRKRRIVAPPRGDVGTGGGYAFVRPAPRRKQGDVQTGAGYRKNRPLVQVADPKGIDLPRARRYAAARRKAEHEARDVKSAADLGRAKTYWRSPAGRKVAPFGTVRQNVLQPGVIENFDRAQRAGALLDAGEIPALVLKNFVDVAKASPNIARATYERPGKTAGSTASSLPGLAASVIAGVGELPLSVIQGRSGDLAKGLLADNLRRYHTGTAAQQRRRIQREGLAAEALDASSALAVTGIGAGTALGTLGTTTRVLAAAERGGRLARLLSDPVSKPRAALRRSAGPAGAVEQDLSENYFKAVSQKAVDRRRARRYAKRAGKVDQGGRAVPVRGLVPGEGEVVKRPGRQARDQRIDVSRQASRNYARQKQRLDREVRQGIERERRKLSPGDRRVETLALQGLLHFDSPKTSIRLLTAHRDRIVRHRAEERERLAKLGKEPHKIPKDSDELARIDETIARLKADPKSVLTPALREYHGLQVERQGRLRAQDQTVADLTAEVRRWQPLGRTLGEHRVFEAAQKRIDEKLEAGDFGKGKEALARATALKARAARQFVVRTSARAQAAGLPEPVYVGHRPRSKAEFAAYSTSESGAVPGVKRSEFRLFDQGRADTSGAAYSDAIAQGIKRNVNWNAVSDTWERHTPEWGRNLRAEELRKVMDDKNLDPADWRVVDLGRFRREREAAGEAQGEGGDVSLEGDTNIHAATVAATHTLEGAQADFKGTGRRLSLVPRGVADELTDMTKRSGKIVRTLQKAQGLQSAAILGLSPTFVPVQVAANAIQSGLAVKGNILNVIRGHREWKQLDQETKHWVEAQLGMSSSSTASSFRPRYGAITNESSALLHNYRVFMDTRAVQGVKRSHANPLNWNARLDDLQNNFFRRAVFKSEIAREARRQGEGQPGEAGPTRHATLRDQEKAALAREKAAEDALHGVRTGSAGERRWHESEERGFQLRLAGLEDQLEGLQPGTGSYEYLRRKAEDMQFAIDRARRGQMAGGGRRGSERRELGRLPTGERRRELQRDLDAARAHRIAVTKAAGDAETMAKHMDDTRSAAQPLLNILKMPDGPEKLAALRRAEPQLDKMADHVNEMLGDYSRFTARERRLARTTLLFYPFLRWALKFTFYTMPVKHPAMSLIAAKLGQLHREEVIQILGNEIRTKQKGVSKEQSEKMVREFAPPWAFGRIYYPKGGEMQSLDLSRISPLATQALDVIPQAGEGGVIHGALKTILGSFSPLGTSILKASIGRDPVTGLPLNVGGAKTPFGQDARMTTKSELGVIGRDLANLQPILRTALKIRDRGQMQGDDLSVIKRNLTSNDEKKLADRAAALGTTKEAILDASIPFRKKGDLGANTYFRHAISDQLSKIAEAKSRIPRSQRETSARYKALTARESELKRRIGALPAKRTAAPGWSVGGGAPAAGKAPAATGGWSVGGG